MTAMTDQSAWRLIRSGHLPGAMNMALDDALLHAVANGSSPPLLRLYRWRPAALTVGYAQQVDAGIDLAACRTAAIDVVRRPTGGRAVLHDQEVTYAVIAPVGAPFGTSVAASYRVIAEVLKALLERFHLPAELVPGQVRGQQRRAVCFTAPAQHELLVAGSKVAGCAQKRRGNAFLQHGSLPLELDLALMQRLLPTAPGEDALARQQAIGWLNRYACRPLTVDEVEDTLIECFAATLGLQLTECPPTAEENAAAERLAAEYYGNQEWTLAGPGWRAPLT
jgi:lipoate-protein ligase A